MRQSGLLIGILLSFSSSPLLAESSGPVGDMGTTAYAASCVSDPLPTTPSGPTWTQTLSVPTISQSGVVGANEDVTLTFWRTPCGANSSALIGLLQRSSQNTAGTSQVLFPGL